MAQDFFVFATTLVCVMLVVASYNRLVQLRHAVAKTWSNIDVLLKQRHEELPRLVEVCRRLMDYEREVLERVMRARALAHAAAEASDVKQVGNSETQMRTALHRLFAVVESYPDLKSDEAFHRLQARLSDLEDAIADRRKFYNDTVTAYNAGIALFPDVIFARLFAFRPAMLLQFGEAEKADVQLDAGFSR